jgi:hypothetical protein
VSPSTFWGASSQDIPGVHGSRSMSIFVPAGNGWMMRTRSSFRKVGVGKAETCVLRGCRPRLLHGTGDGVLF